jgi:hypothetical protein
MILLLLIVFLLVISGADGRGLRSNSISGRKPERVRQVRACRTLQ